MKRSQLKSSIILWAAVLGAVFLSKYAFKDKLVFYPRSFINLGSYLFAKAENLGDFVGKVERFNRLVSEIDKLKEEQKIVLNLKAKVDGLENENDFLRRAARVSQKVSHPVVYAGVYNLNFTPAGYNILLNKGANDGISEGDIVATSEGVLVGIVKNVMQNFSRVLFISDPEFKITAKVINSGTAGIARGALNEGMDLDLIVQDDQIKEGDTLMSVGNDMFPPALVIGSVDHVESEAARMFKKVRIRPAVRDAQLSKVLVIQMK